MKKKTVKDIEDLADKKVFIRVDFNVSLNNGEVGNDTKIIEALPTINYLLSKGAKLLIASHLGRPKGKVDPKYSMLPLVKRTEKYLAKKIHFIPDYWKEETLPKIQLALSDGDIVMIENLRYYPGEEKNDKKFAKHLSSMADIYVNDAFAATHRAHASIVGIPEYLPSYAGFLLEKEIDIISKVLEKPERPMVTIIGGAKTPEKIAVINKLLEVGDTVLLGGAIANTFLAAWGYGMGRSIVDHEMIEMARVIFWKTTREHFALILPEDVVISDEMRLKEPKVVRHDQVANDAVIYDIGPDTCKYYKQIMQTAKTILWNGPMGLFEDKRFREGTECILKALSQQKKAITIIGGGDTLSTIKNDQYLKNITHVSTGGGAMLEFLEHGTLPGIEVLPDA